MSAKGVWVRCTKCGGETAVAFVSDDGRCWECRGFIATDRIERTRADVEWTGRQLGERRDV